MQPKANKEKREGAMRGGFLHVECPEKDWSNTAIPVKKAAAAFSRD